MSTVLVREEAEGEGRLSEFWNAPLATKVFWLLQLGVALEFIGHGMAGLWRSPAWIPYYTFFGFSKEFAHSHLYYVTGTVDITLATVMLIWPNRAVMLHMAVWGLFTATLRPLVGEGMWELVERGANYGMPLALLLLAGWGTWSLRSWFGRVKPPATFGVDLARTLDWVMRVSIALLLVGHTGLGLTTHKAEWLKFFGWFGISPATVHAQPLSYWVAGFEIALAVAVLVKPVRSLLLFVCVYKVGSELLRPLVGQNNFQFIERAGDYVLPITLIWVRTWLAAHADSPARADGFSFDRFRPFTYRPVLTAPQSAPAPFVFGTRPWAEAPAPMAAEVAVDAGVRVDGNGNGHVNGSGNGTSTAVDPEIARAAAALTQRISAQRATVR